MSNEERGAQNGPCSGDEGEQVVRVVVGDPPPSQQLTRTAFLRRIVLGASASSAVTVAVLGLPRLATSAPSAQQDRMILSFALRLEQLQAAFYTEALRRARLQGELRQFATVVGAHERAHVARLTSQLGSSASRAPAFDLSTATIDADHVQAAAIVLEDVALGGYNGQAPALTPAGLRALLPIISVEARHAGWVRSLAGHNPAPHAVDPLPSEAHVRASLHQAGFE
jgi:rubrerythrin